MAVYASLFCRKLAEDCQEGTEKDELVGDAADRAVDLERALVDAKMSLAQTALENGELKMRLRARNGKGGAPPPPGKDP